MPPSAYRIWPLTKSEAWHIIGVAPAAGRGLSADEGVEGVTAAVRLGLAQGSGLERMAKVVTTIHDLVGD